MGLLPQIAIRTVDNAGASPGSPGGSVTGVLLGSTIFLSVFPAIATEMGLSQECVTRGLGLASARQMWKVRNVTRVKKDPSIWIQPIPRVAPAASVLE